MQIVPNLVLVEVIALGLGEGPELNDMADRLQEELMRSRTKRMVLDLGRIQFMASPALSVLVMLSRLAEQHKGALAVFGVRPTLAQLFRLAGMERVLTVCRTRQEAITAVSGAPASPMPAAQHA